MSTKLLQITQKTKKDGIKLVKISIPELTVFVVSRYFLKNKFVNFLIEYFISNVN